MTRMRCEWSRKSIRAAVRAATGPPAAATATAGSRRFACVARIACVASVACLAVVVTFACGLVRTPGACAAELSAAQILERIEGSGILAGSGSATVELITENKRGQQRSNKLKVYRRKDADGTEKQFIEYLEPADVAGTRLLSVTKPGSDAEIWLFMPAIGRERRIAGTETQSKFMGTDFTYEEISSVSAYKSDYTAERSADEELDGRKCYVLRLTPKEKSDYGLLRMWVWQDEFMPLKIEFYGKDGKLRKVLTNTELKRGAKGGWEPSVIAMGDAVAGTKTIVKLIEVSDAPVPDDYFTIRYLRR